MKKCFLFVAVFSFSVLADGSFKVLGPVEAIQRDFKIDFEDCAKVLKVQGFVYGGAYGATVVEKASCEVSLSESEGVIYSQQINETVAKGVTLTASLNKYTLSWDPGPAPVFPNAEEKRVRALNKLKQLDFKKVYLVTGLRTVR